jgi:hypothetical protein
MGNLIDFSVLKVMNQLMPSLSENQLLHIFVILRFPLISICTYYLLSKTINTGKFAFLGSLLFSFIPFNYIRAEGHFVLGSTWTIPLGLAAIYFLWSYLIRDDLSFKKTWTSIFLLLICGLNNFYYGFFIALLGLVYYSIFIVRMFKGKDKNGLKISAAKIIYGTLFFIPSLVGLLIQILPTLYSRNSIQFLYNASTRSPIEPIAYSGSFESLFFETSRTLLSWLERNDLIAYLQTRISWEGTQSGTLVSSSLYLLIMSFCFSLFIMNKPPLSSENLRFWNIGLIVSILLYLPSPLNYAISLLINPLRAWGRLIPIISLFTLCILIYHLSRAKRKSFLVSAICLILLLTSQDFILFRNHRPPARILNQIEETNRNNLNLLTEAFTNKENCGILQLPSYPFPEFDVPYDEAIDYAYLELPLSSDRKLYWSSGAVKGTRSSYWLENLQSQVPPFNRIDIRTQLIYGVQSRPCQVIIDKSMLSSDDVDSLERIFRKLYEGRLASCLFLPKGQSRYLFINTSELSCLKLIESEFAPFEIRLANFFYTEWTGQGLMWRNTTPGGSNFQQFVQWFPSSVAEQDFEIYRPKSHRALVSNVMRVIAILNNNSDSVIEAKICAEGKNRNQASTCISSNVLPRETISTELNLEKLIPTGRSKMRVRLNTNSQSLIWGIVITESNTDKIHSLFIDGAKVTN